MKNENIHLQLCLDSKTGARRNEFNAGAKVQRRQAGKTLCAFAPLQSCNPSESRIAGKIPRPPFYGKVPMSGECLSREWKEGTDHRIMAGQNHGDCHPAAFLYDSVASSSVGQVCGIPLTIIPLTSLWAFPCSIAALVAARRTGHFAPSCGKSMEMPLHEPFTHHTALSQSCAVKPCQTQSNHFFNLDQP